MTACVRTYLFSVCFPIWPRHAWRRWREFYVGWGVWVGGRATVSQSVGRRERNMRACPLNQSINQASKQASKQTRSNPRRRY